MSLADVVTKKIRANIYSGVYAPGHKLIVRELSKELGVSHTPIKDALNRLVAEEYVEALPRKSMIVKQYNHSDFIERMEIRLMCELYCAKAVIERAREGTELIESLKDIEGRILDLPRDSHLSEKETWFRLDAGFHSTYMEAAGNAAMLAMYNRLETQRFSYFAVLQNAKLILDKDRYESDRKAHARIIRAIENRDGDMFRREIVRHIVDVSRDHKLGERDQKRVEKWLVDKDS
jgi:DNA-binding GntR family transcriptional regulator